MLIIAIECYFTLTLRVLFKYRLLSAVMQDVHTAEGSTESPIIDTHLTLNLSEFW